MDGPDTVDGYHPFLLLRQSWKDNNSNETVVVGIHGSQAVYS